MKGEPVAIVTLKRKWLLKPLMYFVAFTPLYWLAYHCPDFMGRVAISIIGYRIEMEIQ